MQIAEYQTIRPDKFSRIDFPSPLWKLYRKSRGLDLGADKKITSWDLEVLTYQERSIPVMMGYCQIDQDNNILNQGVIKRQNVGKIVRQKKEHRKDLWQIGVEDRDRQLILDSFLKEMLKKKYCKGLNFFYNIRYDMSVLLSLLPDSNIAEVYDTNQTEYIFQGEKIKIFVIPEKMLIIKKGKSNTAFYDLAAMTKQSLDNACKSWLDEGKLDIFNVGLVMNDLNLFLRYYNSGELERYCVKDCERTSRLAFEVRKHFNGYNVPFSRPASPASLSKDYIVFNNMHFPKFKHYTLQRDCYTGYYGGLFEFYKRGFFKEARGYDVDSLYPSQMIKLPSLEDCRVMYSHQVDSKADWAVITARVWTDPLGKIMPFSCNAKIKYKDKNKNLTSEKILRPVMTGQEVIMSKQLYDFVTSDKYPYLNKIKIVHVFNIYEKENCRRPFKYLEDLFSKRVQLLKKYGKEDKRQEVLKIMLNSIYGATAEVIEKPKYTKVNGIVYNQGKEYIPGHMFRPFMAFHITELSRLKMYESIFGAGIEDQVIGVATDCIYIQKEGQEAFEEYADVTPKKELGTFSIDYEGDMLAVGNGVYFYRNSKGVKKTTRGFHERKTPNLFFCLHCEHKCFEQKQKIKVVNNRPLGFREVIYFHQGQKELIGIFKEEIKELDINMDRSRTWEREIDDIYDLSSTIIKSEPIILPQKAAYLSTENVKIYYNKRNEDHLEGLNLDDQYKTLENFKNTLILIDQPQEFFQKNKKPRHWITWRGKKVLIFNEAIYGGEIPPEWQGFEFKDYPWIKTGDRDNMRDIILYLIEEREKMLLQYLEVLETELEQGQNPYAYRYEDKEGFMQYKRVKSGNPLWFRAPGEVYNWYSLSSGLSKDRVYNAIENKNPNSQLYHDLRYLAHMILYKGDIEHDWPQDDQYKDLINALEEVIESIKKEGREVAAV